MTHVVLSIGSNIEREKNIRFAISEIEKNYGRLDISPVYETSSVGFDGPPFFNLVAGFHCSDQVRKIRDCLRRIESAAGRIRGRKTFDSRVLDIDILLYGQHNLKDQGYNIPRDEIERFAYVLKPLADLYPDMVYPLTGETVIYMWQRFKLREQSIFITDFPIISIED